MPAFAYGARSHRGRVGAGIRFGLREAGDFLADQNRIEIAALLFALQRQQDRTDKRTEQRMIPRRHGYRARYLVPEHRHAGKPQALAAEFLRHIEKPEAGILRLFLNRAAIRLFHRSVVRTEAAPVRRNGAGRAETHRVRTAMEQQRLSVQCRRQQAHSPRRECREAELPLLAAMRFQSRTIFAFQEVANPFRPPGIALTQNELHLLGR